ncbi:1-acyl-sn-glycerol-3-phosphate acyltransferase BAT2, chloroplastic-like isoform X1 [Magnolia sinica]|uniref:1-acyl-sn-glycerol-3-phosphate acyltransferase BAT2, chloroplastic-like isoform X1 n=1 Tax=Magnolia sinica TaxID=86752 RepID=UPI002659E3F7|nr:1-acyl-sn-glycerol-3-phosphate acyltransferase BAT2, chloroplastic-like isoform X1 [Magnolia sinica]XP_058085806.1 1-acyl-sn-glycerol-3-phosphate acyltransferase BAT2, chloroplastic-like isoform X1 [Magnolia sinica]
MASFSSLPQTPLYSKPSFPNPKTCSTFNNFPRIVYGFPKNRCDRFFDFRRPYSTVPLQIQYTTCRNTPRSSSPYVACSLTEFQLGLVCRSCNTFPLRERYTVMRSEFHDAASHSTEFQFGSKRRACNTIPLLRQYSMRRNTVVRSEVSGTGSAGAAYPLAEFQWVSKLRGICFYAVTSIAAIFLFVAMLVSHPFVLLFDRYRRKAHHVIAKIWASLTVAPFFKVEFEGLENLPPSDSPAVYVSNHQSFLDIYTVLILGRSFKFISKTDIFIIPIIGWAMFLMGLIPLRRMDSRSQLECFKRCMDLVRKGASVFFFPEGTRSKDGKLSAFKKGAFSVAAKTGVPVVPITLMGTGNLMPSGREGILNTGSVRAVIHKPIEGSNPELLCDAARNAIADVLLLHGYGVQR